MRAPREAVVERVDDDRRRSSCLSRAPPVSPRGCAGPHFRPRTIAHTRGCIARASRPRVRVHEALSLEREKTQLRTGARRRVLVSPNETRRGVRWSRAYNGENVPARPYHLVAPTTMMTSDDDDDDGECERPTVAAEAEEPRSTVRTELVSSSLVTSRHVTSRLVARVHRGTPPVKGGLPTNITTDDLRAGEITR